MLVLGIDTSTDQLGLALARDGRVVAEIAITDGLQHCERLIVGLDGLLGDLGLQPDAIEGISVAAGPGSFTGLRIGLAAAQGLAAARDLPMAAVSTLEALAVGAASTTGPVVPCLDARRGEVYVGAYRVAGAECKRLIDDMVVPLEDVGTRLGLPGGEPVVVVGNMASRVTELLTVAGLDASAPVFMSPHPRPGIVAILGASEIASGGRASAEIEPVYLRRPDARLPQSDKAARRA